MKKYCKAEYVQRRVCFINVQSSLPENVVFSVCAYMGNAAYIIFIMWNSMSCLDAWYHIQFNISCCGVAVTVRSHQKKMFAPSPPLEKLPEIFVDDFSQ